MAVWSRAGIMRKFLLACAVSSYGAPRDFRAEFIMSKRVFSCLVSIRYVTQLRTNVVSRLVIGEIYGEV